jgi:hypothetical protein
MWVESDLLSSGGDVGGYLLGRLDVNRYSPGGGVGSW